MWPVSVQDVGVGWREERAKRCFSGEFALFSCDLPLAA
jgi:hypothetical protein